METPLHNKKAFLKLTEHSPGIGLGIADSCLSNGALKIYSLDIGPPGEEFASLSSRFPKQLFALPSRRNKRTLHPSRHRPNHPRSRSPPRHGLQRRTNKAQSSPRLHDRGNRRSLGRKPLRGILLCSLRSRALSSHRALKAPSSSLHQWLHIGPNKRVPSAPYGRL